jgi:hypothetical protein
LDLSDIFPHTVTNQCFIRCPLEYHLIRFDPIFSMHPTASLLLYLFLCYHHFCPIMSDEALSVLLSLHATTLNGALQNRLTCTNSACGTLYMKKVPFTTEQETLNAHMKLKHSKFYLIAREKVAGNIFTHPHGAGAWDSIQYLQQALWHCQGCQGVYLLCGQPCFPE